jgi:uncharacterized RDD family membrane protein YckC
MPQRGAGDRPSAGASQVEAAPEIPVPHAQGTPPGAAAKPAESTDEDETPTRASTDGAVPGPRAGSSAPDATQPGDGSQPAQAVAVAGHTSQSGLQPAASRPKPATQVSQPGHPEAGEHVLASWQRRLIGYLIDSLIIFAVTSALWIRLFISFGNRMSNTLNAHPHTGTATAQAAIGRVFSTTLGPFLVELVFTMVLAVLYYWVLTGNWGTTVGKRCVSAWVVLATGGTRPSLGASFLRAVVFVVCAPILPLFLIDNLWLFAGRRRQCLHDKAARTIVVRGRPAP